MQTNTPIIHLQKQQSNQSIKINLNSQSPSDLQIIQHLDRLLSISKLDQAFQYLQSYNEHSHPSLNQNCQFQQLKYRINIQYTKLTEIQELVQKKGSWIVNEDKPDYKIYYKQATSGKGLYVKFQTVLDIKPFGLFSILSDHNSYKKWMPFCKQGNLVKQLGISDKVIHFRSEYPVVSTREAILYGFGVNRLDIDDTIMIVAYSVNDCQQFQDQLGLDYKQYLKSGSVFLDLPSFCFILDMKKYRQDELCKNPSKIEDRQCQIPVDSILSVNPSISWIPQKILDYVLNLVIKNLFKQIIKTSLEYSEKDYNPQCKELYDWLRLLINEYIKPDKK